MDIRSKRKHEHIKYALKLEEGPLSTGFEDIYLIHQALSSLSLREINTEITLFEKKLQAPLLINAITGGGNGLEKLNGKLAKAAAETGLAMAVGSQAAGVSKSDLEYTYKIVRKVNPKGLIFANIGFLSPPSYAVEAVEMIQADALQIHLNIAQELAMFEGDRDFSRILENIYDLKEKSPVPVIVKEVGFGISKETIKKIEKLGIKYVDISGAGGTNFAAIENARNGEYGNESLIKWGIPTAISLLETLTTKKDLSIIASGGIYSPLDMVKALVLGARLVGIAMPALRLIWESEPEIFIKYLEKLKKDIKELMVLVEAKEIKDLQSKPVIITGFVKEWLTARGIDINGLAQR